MDGSDPSGDYSSNLCAFGGLDAQTCSLVYVEFASNSGGDDATLGVADGALALCGPLTSSAPADALMASDTGSAGDASDGEDLPPAQMPEGAIDKMIQAVKDVWPNIVMPGGSTKKGQPEQLYQGFDAHRAIARSYTAANPYDVPMYTNYFPVKTILRDGYSITNTTLSQDQLDSKPDIVNVARNWIYEIKSVRQYGAAVLDLTRYLNAFHAAGEPTGNRVVDMSLGPSNGMGTAGVAPAPGGYFVFGSIAPGVILYEQFDGTFEPKPGQQSSSIEQALAAAAQAAARAAAEAAAAAAALDSVLNPAPPGVPAYA